MNREAFREIFGKKTFDELIAGITEDQIERGEAVEELSRLNRMLPVESGTTIERGREVLAAASRSDRPELTGEV